MKDVLQSAIRHIGTAEVPGKKNNPIIMQYSQELGLFKWVHDDETPWCALFANYHLKQCGRQYLESARVKDFLKSDFGLRLKHATYGCLVVLNPSHVGFFVGYASDGVQVLGGNQSDTVNISTFPIVNIKEFIYCP